MCILFCDVHVGHNIPSEPEICHWSRDISIEKNILDLDIMLYYLVIYQCQ